VNGLERLTEEVLGAVFEVSNTLGVGFLEKVYERALVRELGLRGIRGAAQAPLTVAYKGHTVGCKRGTGTKFRESGEIRASPRFAPVEGVLVVELKCVERLVGEHTAQCLNYLRASGLGVCLLINFQRSKVEWRRILRTGGMATDEHG
jgi:hypothetical protein